jgi:hypothetical protein
VANLAPDPSYELGAGTPWVQGNIGGCDFQGAALAHDGTWAVFLTASKQFGMTLCGSTAVMVTGLVVGLKYDVSVWLNRLHTAPSPGGRNCILALGNTTLQVDDDNDWNGTFLDDWRQLSFSVESAEGTSLQLSAQTEPGLNGAGQVTWYVDSWSVERNIIPLGTPVFVRRGEPGTVS